MAVNIFRRTDLIKEMNKKILEKQDNIALGLFKEDTSSRIVEKVYPRLCGHNITYDGTFTDTFAKTGPCKESNQEKEVFFLNYSKKQKELSHE